MHYTPHCEWWFEFTLEAQRAVTRANKQQLLMIAYGLAVLSSSGDLQVAPELLAAVLARARTLLGVAPAAAAPAAAAGPSTAPDTSAPAGSQSSRSSSSSGDGGSFTAAECVNLTQSLVHLHVAPGAPLLSSLYNTFLRQLPQPGVQGAQTQPPAAAAAAGGQIATMLWALGAFWRSNAECLWLRQHPGIVAALVTAAQPHLCAVEVMHLKRLLVALAAMGYNPGPGFLLAHEAAVVGLVGQLWPKTLEHMLRAYKELGFSGPGQQVLREALGRKLQDAQQQQQQQQQQV
jgi:hypothetical protein